ncbi:MAG: YbjQ family protein [Sciscionella sp.]
MGQPMQQYQQQPQQYQQQPQQYQEQPQQQPFPILISTMNDVPGYRSARVFGEVFGLTVRSRNAFSNIGASFKAIAGGELKGLSKLLADSRHEAINRMAQDAMAMGANAVVAMRFDCNEIAGAASEIAAYGTAVYLVADAVEPRPPGPHQPHTPPQA